MAECIEREAAIKCAEESYKMWNLTMAAADGEREINKCYKMQELCKAIGEVFKIVPAADVAPVVRCSDCIFQGFLDSDYSGCFCERSREEIQPNDFCSHAVSWEQQKASLGGAKMDEEEVDD